MAKSEKSSAKQIVDLNGDKITPNADLLREIFLQPDIKNKKVCVISITGTVRQGKSFLLNFFVRYLKLKYKMKKMVTEKWLDPEHGRIKGFPWKCGSNRHTSGILIWSEIFLAELPSGEEIAIVLMDTQGLFDCKSSKQHSALIFAISTLISSVQIFNLKEKIAQYDLDHLEFLSRYTLGLNQNSEFLGPVFQNLCFLIRDWPFAHEFDYGLNGGEKMLEKVKTASKQEPDKFFQNIKCCLLPFPGPKVAGNPSFNGDLKDMDDEFKTQVEQFVSTILAPENLVPKIINGQEIRVGDLVSNIQNYCQNLSSDTIPSLNEPTISEDQLKIVLHELVKIYKQSMDFYVHNVDAFKNNTLENYHSEQKHKIMIFFTDGKIMGNGKVKESHKKLLETKLENHFLKYREITILEPTKKKTREIEQMQHQIDYFKHAISCYEHQLQEEKNRRLEEKFEHQIQNIRKEMQHREEISKKELSHQQEIFEEKWDKAKEAQRYQQQIREKEKEIQIKKEKRQREQLEHRDDLFKEKLHNKDKEIENQKRIQEQNNQQHEQELAHWEKKFEEHNNEIKQLLEKIDKLQYENRSLEKSSGGGGEWISKLLEFGLEMSRPFIGIWLQGRIT